MKNLLSVPLLVLLTLAVTTAHESISERYEALSKEYEAARAAWNDRFDASSPDVDSVERYRTWPAWEFAPRFLEIAREAPEDPLAFDALVWVVRQGSAGDAQFLPHYKGALELFLCDHLGDERLGQVCRMVAADTPAGEDFLRRVLEVGPNREVRGQACLALGRGLAVRREDSGSHWFDSPGKTPFEEFFLRRLDALYIESIRQADPEALFGEAESLFERVIAEFGDIPAMRSDGTLDDGRNLADLAKSDLNELRNLSVGSVAPEIEGVDMNGDTLRLSDYRGKVVALVSWATWCGPCMGMVPHERELVKRLEGEPFALLGINGDDDRDQALAVIRAEGMTWRSWWNGGPTGPITEAWNIKAWPTIYVLDANSVIRYKGLRGEQLDEAIDTLLAELKFK